MELQVTSLEKLKEKAKGTLIKLPGWDEEPFICRVKRVSLLGMVTQGLIPNNLLGAADKVFNKPNPNVDMKEMGKLFEILTKETMVEPSYSDLESIGLKLTDEQQLILFNFTQQGLKALERFHTEQPSAKDSKDSATV